MCMDPTAMKNPDRVDESHGRASGISRTRNLYGSDELGSRSMGPGSFGWAAGIGRLREGQYDLSPSDERCTHFLSLVTGRIGTR